MLCDRKQKHCEKGTINLYRPEENCRVEWLFTVGVSRHYPYSVPDPLFSWSIVSVNILIDHVLSILVFIPRTTTTV